MQSETESVKCAVGGNRQKRIIQIAAALLLLVCSTWFCFVGVRIFRQISSSKWLAVEGLVLDMTYREYASRRSGERGAAEMTVRYEYVLDGQTYQSDEFMVGVKKYKRDAEHISALTNQYDVGAPVRVLYNPKHPGQAVLRSDPDQLDKITIVFLAAIIAFVAFNFKTGSK